LLGKKGYEKYKKEGQKKDSVFNKSKDEEPDDDECKNDNKDSWCTVTEARKILKKYIISFPQILCSSSFCTNDSVSSSYNSHFGFLYYEFPVQTFSGDSCLVRCEPHYHLHYEDDAWHNSTLFLLQQLTTQSVGSGMCC
jgi:hypothetical protein